VTYRKMFSTTDIFSHRSTITILGRALHPMCSGTEDTATHALHARIRMTGTTHTHMESLSTRTVVHGTPNRGQRGDSVIRSVDEGRHDLRGEVDDMMCGEENSMYRVVRCFCRSKQCAARLNEAAKACIKHITCHIQIVMVD